MLVLGQEQGNTWLCDVNTANTRDAGRGILAKEVFQLLPCSSLWSEPFKFFRVFQLPRTVFSAIRKRGGSFEPPGVESASEPGRLVHKGTHV